MTKKQHYMTRDERYKLEAFLQVKKPVAWIARELGFTPKTIYNEIKRGLYEHDCGWYTEWRYSADKAQQVHEYNQTSKGRPLKIGHDHTYAAFLEARCLGIQPDGSIDRRRRYSPAAALELARREGFQTSICPATFYSYIEKGVFLRLSSRHLWEKCKRAKRSSKPVRRISHPQLPSIGERPTFINQRTEPGHWEMDLIAGKAKTQPVILTLYERFTREFLLFKLPNRKAATIRAAIDRIERTTPDFRQRFKTITTDNGPEFLEYEKLRRSIRGGVRFQVYYCHPYSAWEKGGNECYNRIVRRWFPKGTDFSHVTKKEIAALQDWMNGYPRKVLGWKTPKELTA